MMNKYKRTIFYHFRTIDDILSDKAIETINGDNLNVYIRLIAKKVRTKLEFEKPIKKLSWLNRLWRILHFKKKGY